MLPSRQYLRREAPLKQRNMPPLPILALRSINLHPVQRNSHHCPLKRGKPLRNELDGKRPRYVLRAGRYTTMLLDSKRLQSEKTKKSSRASLNGWSPLQCYRPLSYSVILGTRGKKFSRQIWQLSRRSEQIISLNVTREGMTHVKESSPERARRDLALKANAHLVRRLQLKALINTCPVCTRTSIDAYYQVFDLSARRSRIAVSAGSYDLLGMCSEGLVISSERHIAEDLASRLHSVSGSSYLYVCDGREPPISMSPRSFSEPQSSIFVQCIVSNGRGDDNWVMRYKPSNYSPDTRCHTPRLNSPSQCPLVMPAVCSEPVQRVSWNFTTPCAHNTEESLFRSPI
jgi:hypothetical protein